MSMPVRSWLNEPKRNVSARQSFKRKRRCANPISGSVLPAGRAERPEGTHCERTCVRVGHTGTDRSDMLQSLARSADHASSSERRVCGPIPRIDARTVLFICAWTCVRRGAARCGGGSAAHAAPTFGEAAVLGGPTHPEDRACSRAMCV